MLQNKSQVNMLWKMGVLTFVLIVLNSVAALPVFRNVLEDIAYRLDPSATRAFAYGERHFSASNAEAYDIDRAEYFFNQAAAKDPTIFYLYHELARISFLRGNFRTALARIDFQISMHGDETPNSYYVRGLIEGYMGKYDASIRDYEHFLRFDPRNWAGINDYAWVLLKANRPRDAVVASAGGLVQFPDNAWLLNTNAIGLYEMGLLEPARMQAHKAVVAASKVTEAEWLVAYPGNDPEVASEGIAALQRSALQNMHSIALALASSTVQ
jgi:tetratricopeptide (TPR) repeat protein